MSVRIGTDTSKFPGAAELGAVGVLERVAELGLDGAFFRSCFELSPELDAGELLDVAQAAEDLGLYLQAGIAKINPFASPAFPEIRRLGDGDTLRGLERMILATSAAGITELWTATAAYQFELHGLRACDRFRTDVAWADQLTATGEVLRRLTPVLRDCGARLNIETHEEITSFEVVRLVEEAGPDVAGVTFDTANVLVRCEDPLAAARRVAPYVHATHLRDAALLFTDDGIGRFLAPIGRGVIDWPVLLGILLEANPGLPLSIEPAAIATAEMPLYLDDPEWQAGHPDLTVAELAEVVRLTRSYEARAARGEVTALDELRLPVGPATTLTFLLDSAAELRRILGPEADTSSRVALPAIAAL